MQNLGRTRCLICLLTAATHGPHSLSCWKGPGVDFAEPPCLLCANSAPWTRLHAGQDTEGGIEICETRTRHACTDSSELELAKAADLASELLGHWQIFCRSSSTARLLDSD